jgi:hypothetical protein
MCTSYMLQVAVGLYPNTTLGAANVWMLPLDSLERARDDVGGWLGVTPQRWGVLLLAAALVYIVVTVMTRLRRTGGLVAACWASAAVALASFMLPTRVHERYVLPVLGLLLLLAAVRVADRLLAIAFWVVSGCLTVNMGLVIWGGVRGPGGQTFVFGWPWWLALSLVYCVITCYLLAWPWFAFTSDDHADSRRAPGAVRLRQLPRRGNPLDPRASVIDRAG